MVGHITPFLRACTVCRLLVPALRACGMNLSAHAVKDRLFGDAFDVVGLLRGCQCQPACRVLDACDTLPSPQHACIVVLFLVEGVGIK